LKFHSVDLLLKIVEHQLETPDKLDTIEEIFLCVKAKTRQKCPLIPGVCCRKTLHDRTSHEMALMGATGVTELFMRSGRYRPYGSRCGAGNPLRGKAAFRWAGKVSDTSCRRPIELPFHHVCRTDGARSRLCADGVLEHVLVPEFRRRARLYRRGGRPRVLMTESIIFNA
jgi:hypothetical protein